MPRSDFRRPGRAIAAFVVAMLTSIVSPLLAQNSSYPSAYGFRDSTSVGFVAAPYYHPGGYYGYGSPYRAPAGEFGGYLYRSPKHYLDFRGPEYVPVAGSAVGLPVAGRDGRVPIEDVPLWTDEWAARIVQNRASAGLRVDSIEAVAPRAAPPIAPSRVMPPAVAPRRSAPRIEAPVHTPMTPIAPAMPPRVKTNEPAALPPTIETPRVESSPSKSIEAVMPESEAITDNAAIASVVNPGSSDSESIAPDEIIPDSAPEPSGERSSAPAAHPVVVSPPTRPAPAPEALNRATAAGIAIGRGDKSFEQGEYGDARAEYERALDLAGEQPGVRIALGLAEYAQGSFREAAQAIRQGVSLSPELAASSFQLQDVYGRLSEAHVHRRILDDHVTQNPEDADALFLLGFVQYFSNERNSASNTFGAYRSLVSHDDLADAFIESAMRQAAYTPDE